LDRREQRVRVVWRKIDLVDVEGCDQGDAEEKSDNSTPMAQHEPRISAGIVVFTHGSG